MEKLSMTLNYTKVIHSALSNWAAEKSIEGVIYLHISHSNLRNLVCEKILGDC